MGSEKAELDPKKWMIVEFEGTYRVAHPDGIKGQTVLRPFHIKVPMRRSYLKDSYNLRAPFGSFYKQRLINRYPGMIKLHHTKLIEATNPDGSIIKHPKAMSYDNLLEYIAENEYPINIGLYDDQQLRNEVVLYEKDAPGQQHLQANQERVKGSVLAVGQELDALGSDAFEILSTTGIAEDRKDREQALKHTKTKPNVEERRVTPGVTKELVTTASKAKAADKTPKHDPLFD